MRACELYFDILHSFLSVFGRSVKGRAGSPSSVCDVCDRVPKGMRNNFSLNFWHFCTDFVFLYDEESGHEPGKLVYIVMANVDFLPVCITNCSQSGSTIKKVAGNLSI